MGDRHSVRLRRVANADEVLRVQLAYAMDEVVAMFRPVPVRRLIPDMVSHRRSAEKRSSRRCRVLTATLAERLPGSLETDRR